VLWALGQPAAAVGLICAFVLGLGLRAVAQRSCARWLGDRLAVRPSPRTDIDPLGALAVLVGGTGWGRRAAVAPASLRRRALVLAAGPVAVIGASQVALAAFRVAYPNDLEALRLNRPSDVLRGVIAPTMAEQLVLSVAVGLLCFGLLALVPVPPLDGYRLLRLVWGLDGEAPAVADQLGVVALLILFLVPIGGTPPLLTALDWFGAPLLGLWA
jgi:Zn-dependent protease